MRSNLRAGAALALVAAIALIPRPAAAWEAWGWYDWQSHFFGLRDKDDATELNEHLTMAEQALWIAWLDGRFGEAGRRWYAADIGTVFGHRLSDPDPPGGEPEDAHEATAIEDRLVTPPVHFAGLPDFSYTVYDWINKNQLCPVLEPNDPTLKVCYEYFGGWLAALNSSHFGTQARNNYLHLHAIALRLAGRAVKLEGQLAAGGEPAVWAYAEYVSEAQDEAMMYEAVGQHFLEDRWSTGHMWERYGSSEPTDIDEPPQSLQDVADTALEIFEVLGLYGAAPGMDDQLSDDITVGTVVLSLQNPKLLSANLMGALSGLIHGAESMLGFPDPMCSPQTIFQDGQPIGAEPVQWTDGQAHYPGIGDERYHDAFTTEYEVPGDGPTVPLLVDEQLDRIRECGRAGFGEVAKAMGLNASPGAAPVNAPGGSCWNQWATNQAVHTGLFDFGSKVPESVRSAVAELDAAVQEGFGIVNWAKSTLKAKLPPGMGPLIDQLDPEHKISEEAKDKLGAVLPRDLVELMVEVYFERVRDPDGTSVATGKALPTMFAIRHGGAQAKDLDQADTGPTIRVPFWMEPVDFDTLPQEDERGRDKQTVFGFFNRAHASYWCDVARFRAVIEPLRKAEGATEAEVNACMILADRFYGGTDPAYRDGDVAGQAERRRVEPGLNHAPPGGLAGAPLRTVCDLVSGVTEWEDGEEVPVTLHVGYVRSQSAHAPHEASFPFEQGEAGEVRARWIYESVSNWCRRVAIADYLWMPAAQSDQQAHWKSLVHLWDQEDTWDVVAVSNGKVPIELTGRHFGHEKGGVLVMATDDPGENTGLEAPVLSWSNTRIVFDLPQGDLGFGDWYLRIIPANTARASAGRFVLRVDDTLASPPTPCEALLGDCAASTAPQPTCATDDDCKEELLAAPLLRVGVSEGMGVGAVPRTSLWSCSVPACAKEAGAPTGTCHWKPLEDGLPCSLCQAAAFGVPSATQWPGLQCGGACGKGLCLQGHCRCEGDPSDEPTCEGFTEDELIGLANTPPRDQNRLRCASCCKALHPTLGNVETPCEQLQCLCRCFGSAATSAARAACESTDYKTCAELDGVAQDLCAEGLAWSYSTWGQPADPVPNPVCGTAKTSCEVAGECLGTAMPDSCESTTAWGLMTLGLDPEQECLLGSGDCGASCCGPCQQWIASESKCDYQLCTVDGCEALVAFGAPCDDGDPCTSKDRCEEGKCVADPPFDGCCSTTTDCPDDGLECTLDHCEMLGGVGTCLHLAFEGCCSAGASCDDGDPCTDDACDIGKTHDEGEFLVCSHVAVGGAGCGEPGCGNNVVEEGEACEAAQWCDGGQACDLASCACVPAFSCDWTVAGAPYCVNFTGSGLQLAKDAQKSTCELIQGTFEDGSCPMDEAVGVCVLSAGTPAEQQYVYIGITVGEAQQLCSASSGLWSPVPP